MTSTSARAIAAVVLGAAVTAAVPPIADAGPSPHMRFGMVGVTRGQTARLSAVLIDDPNAVPPDGGDRSCTVELGFVDGTGRSLGRASARLVAGGAPAVLDAAIDDPNIRPRARVQLRATIALTNPPDGDRPGLPPGPCASVVPTLEIFNAQTGETTVVQNPVVTDPPDPGFE
jgi:hypothetical protein